MRRGGRACALLLTQEGWLGLAVPAGWWLRWEGGRAGLGCAALSVKDVSVPGGGGGGGVGGRVPSGWCMDHVDAGCPPDLETVSRELSLGLSFGDRSTRAGPACSGALPLRCPPPPHLEAARNPCATSCRSLFFLSFHGEPGAVQRAFKLLASCYHNLIQRGSLSRLFDMDSALLHSLFLFLKKNLYC